MNSASSPLRTKCTMCPQLQERVAELEEEVDILQSKLCDLQAMHNDEVASLNATIAALRASYREERQRGSQQLPSVPLSPPPERNVMGEAVSRGPNPGPLAGPTQGDSPTKASSNVERILPPLRVLRRDDDTIRNLALQLLKNPNQLGDIVHTEFSPECEAARGSSAHAEEMEHRRSSSAWFEASMLQVTLTHYAEKIIGLPTKSDRTVPRGSSEERLSGSAGDEDSENGKSPVPKTKQRHSHRRKKVTEERSALAYARLIGNEPVVNGPTDPASVPMFSAENLSPALHKVFSPGAAFAHASAHRRTLSGQSLTTTPTTPSATPFDGSASKRGSTSKDQTNPYGGGKGVDTAKHTRTGSGGDASPLFSPRGSLSDTIVYSTGPYGGPRPRRLDEVKVEFYYPSVFRRIMRRFNLNLEELAAAAMYCPWRTVQSPGKSESRFYYFGHFVLKTMTEAEVQFAEDHFMDAYAKHIENNPETLLPKVYGIISVCRLKSGETATFMLSNNILHTQCYVSKVFDLKGSTVGRDGVKEEGTVVRTAAGAKLLKDNDLPSGPFLMVGNDNKGKLLGQLKADTNFLEKLQVIDYSLLVGVRSRRGYNTVNSPGGKSLRRPLLESTMTALPRQSPLAPSRYPICPSRQKTQAFAPSRFLGRSMMDSSRKRTTSASSTCCSRTAAKRSLKTSPKGFW